MQDFYVQGDDSDVPVPKVDMSIYSKQDREEMWLMWVYLWRRRYQWCTRGEWADAVGMRSITGKTRHRFGLHESTIRHKWAPSLDFEVTPCWQEGNEFYLTLLVDRDPEDLAIRGTMNLSQQFRTRGRNLRVHLEWLAKYGGSARSRQIAKLHLIEFDAIDRLNSVVQAGINAWDQDSGEAEETLRILQETEEGREFLRKAREEARRRQREGEQDDER